MVGIGGGSSNIAGYSSCIIQEQSNSEQTSIVQSLACADPRMLKHLSSMWCARFGA